MNTKAKNLHEARQSAAANGGVLSVDKLRDRMVAKANFPAEAIPSRTTWHRADKGSVAGVDPVLNGLDSIICLWIAEELDVPYETVSPIASQVAESARDLLRRKTRCSSASLAA